MAFQNLNWYAAMDEEGTTRGYKAGRALGRALGNIFGNKTAGTVKDKQNKDESVSTESVKDSDAWHAPMALPEEGKPAQVTGELKNVVKAGGKFLPDLDLIKGKKGWIPDWLEGKQGLLPDYLQGKQGLWPDYLPSMGWDAPPEISGTLAEGIDKTSSKLADKFRDIPGIQGGPSQQEMQESQYPEEKSMQHYLDTYGSSKASEGDFSLNEAMQSISGPGITDSNPWGNQMIQGKVDWMRKTGHSQEEIIKTINDYLATLKGYNQKEEFPVSEEGPAFQNESMNLGNYLGKGY